MSTSSALVRAAQHVAPDLTARELSELMERRPKATLLEIAEGAAEAGAAYDGITVKAGNAVAVDPQLRRLADYLDAAAGDVAAIAAEDATVAAL